MKANFHLFSVFFASVWMFSCGGEQAVLETVQFKPNPLTALVERSTASSDDPEFTACFMDGERLLYRFEVMDRQLAENAELRRLAGFSSTEHDCDRGYRTIQAKNYLSGLQGGDVETEQANGIEVSPGGVPVVKQSIENGDRGGTPWTVKVSFVRTIRRSDDDVRTFRGACNGVTIKDGVVLTSGHCAVGANIGYNISGETSDGRSTFCMTSVRPRGVPGQNPCGTGRDDYPLTEKHRHPDWTGDGDFGDDIAILRLPGGWVDYPNDYATISRVLPGKTAPLSMSSFGPLACNNTPNTSLRHTASFIGLGADSPRRYVSYSNTANRYQTCEGDDGAPISVPSLGGPRDVAALHSSSDELVDCRVNSDENFRCSRGVGYATILRPKVDWIAGIIGECPFVRTWFDCTLSPL